MSPAELNVSTKQRTQFVDLTAEVNRLIAEHHITDGICHLYVPHTTAGITVNEAADPSVPKDIIKQLEKIAPRDGGYQHLEGNADAHIKATLTGCSVTLFIQEGKLLLGTWQGVFFCEFDGPRTRKVYVKFITS